MIDATNPKDISNRYALRLICRATDMNGDHYWVRLLEHKGIASFDSALILANQYMTASRNFMSKFGYDTAEVHILVMRPIGAYAELHMVTGTPFPYYVSSGSTGPTDEAVIKALCEENSPALAFTRPKGNHNTQCP